MTIFLDIVGSLMIRATMVVIVLSVNVTLNNAMYEKSARVVLKQKLTTLVDIMRNDIRHMGYGASPGLYVSSYELGFWGDIDNNGSAENVYYYLDNDPSQPGLKIMYRLVNWTGQQEVGRGIDSFLVTMYNSWGNVTTNVSYARSLKLTIRMKSDVPLSYRDPANERIYPRHIWEMHLFPKNL